MIEPDSALLAQHLLTTLGSTQTAVAAGLAAIAAAGAAISVPPLLQMLLLRPYREDRYGDLLPLDSPLEDGVTLRCVDGSLVVTLEIWGVNSHGLGGSDRIGIRERKNELLFGLAALDVRQRWFVQRRRQAMAPALRHDAHPQRRKFVERWNSQFSDTFLTRHVLALSTAGSSSGARTRLRNALGLAVEVLKPFGVRVMPTTAASDGCSDALTFWAGIANSAAGERFPAQQANLGQALATGHVDFWYRTDGRIDMLAGNRSRHGFMVSLNTMPAETTDDILAGLLVLPHELTIVQHIEALSPTHADTTLDVRQRQAANTFFPSEARAQYDAARAAVAPGSEARLALCRHSAFVIAWGRSAAEAADAREAVRSELRRQRILPVDEVDEVHNLWWSQWPSFDSDLWMRGHLLLSRAVADLVTLERAPIGLASCCWGQGPALRCRTTQGTAYQLALHESQAREAPAHTIVFGRIGSGKTTFATMLAMSALVQFPDLVVRYFDRGHGQYVAVRAHGGRYVRFDGTRPTDDATAAAAAAAAGGSLQASLQPFRRELTPERRMHILQLLRLMTGDVGATPEAATVFDHMLRHLARLEPRDRGLERLVQICAPVGSAVREALRPWLPGGAYGHVFGHGSDDTTGLSGTDLVAFDMTGILADSRLAPVVIADLAFEIGAEAFRAGRPGLIGLDEARGLFQSPAFLAMASTWLYELRKARQAVVLMFQSPGQIDESAEMMLRTQTATHVFFRDASAHPRDYARWGLTQRELAFIRGEDHRTAHIRYACLVKKPSLGESVVLDIGLQPVGDLALMFRSGAPFVQAFAEAERQGQGDAAKTLAAYLDRAGALEDGSRPVEVHQQGEAA